MQICDLQQVQRYLDSLQVSCSPCDLSFQCDTLLWLCLTECCLQDTGVQRQNADFYQLWRVKHDKEAEGK